MQLAVYLRGLALATLVVVMTSALAMAKSVSLQSHQSQTQSPDRLPSTVEPSKYTLMIEPDLNTFTFRGDEVIAIKVSEPRDKIILNSLDLEILDVTVEKDTKVGKQRCSVTLNPRLEQAEITIPKRLQPGPYSLAISFKGKLNDRLEGFYRSHYIAADGSKHWLASTQFEATDARRMFPCFDEPQFKAEFQIYTAIDPKLTAISNSPIQDESNHGKRKVVRFEPTPRMSSYLVALIVGDMKATPVKISNGVPIRVWAPAGKEQMGIYSRDAACDILTFLTDYFGIPYPAKKLDLIAIPDFGPGAMENLGAITFKDSILLSDDRTATTFSRRGAFGTIAHEMAHQWFGDLVTMKWWDDVWLNEAFATWMAAKTEAGLHPEWRTKTKEVSSRLGAMSTDELKSTRAIHADVTNPRQAFEMFDSITYEKGASVLSMLESAVSEKVFQQGIHEYLTAHKFANATAADLWNAIAHVGGGFPVADMMQTWIMQPGFPLLTITHDSPRGITISQNRFFVMPGQEPDKSKWIVPFSMMTLQPSSTPQVQILQEESHGFGTSPESATPVLNVDGKGVYRTKYQQSDFEKIQEHFDSLSPENKLTLISDTSALVTKGAIPVEDRLAFIMRIKGEHDQIVLQRLIHNLASPRNFMDGSTRPAYEKLIVTLLLPLKKELGWTEKQGEPELAKDVRGEVLDYLGTYGQDKETIQEARDLWQKYQRDVHLVPPNVVPTVLGIVSYNGSAQDYADVKAAWKKATNPQQERRLLFTLPAFRQPDLVAKTLELAMSPEVRSEHGVALLGDLVGSYDTREQAWKFVKEHWTQISKKFPVWSLNHLASACTSFDAPELEKEAQSFWAANPLPYGKSAVARMLEDVHIAVLYRQKNEQKIRNWVKQAL